METRSRTILFWGFFLVFLVVAPLVILYTSGYRYNPATKRPAQTGGISVTTTPRGANLTLNGKVSQDTSPALLRFVPPGISRLDITRDGFFPLSMQLTVTRKQTTLLEDIVLWMNKRPELQERDPLTLVPDHASTSYVLAVATDTWTEIWRVPFENPLARTLIARVPSAQAKDLTMTWSPDSTWLLLHSQSNLPRAFLVRFDGSETLRLTDQKEISGFTPLTLSWAAGTPHTLVATGKGETRLWDVEREITALAVETESVAYTKEAFLTLASDATKTVVMKEFGLSGTPIAVLPKSMYQFVESPDPYITLTDGASLIVLDPRSSNAIVLKTDATMFAWSPNGESLAYSNGYTTMILDREKDSKTMVAHTSDPGTALVWHPRGTALVIAGAKDTMAYDLSLGKARTRLFEARDVADMVFKKDGERFWFLGTVSETYGLYEERVR